MKKLIILASNSPRRKELLLKHGYDIKVFSANTEESFDGSLPPEEIVKMLALEKAKATKKALLNEKELQQRILEEEVSMHSSLEIPILAADTVVYLDEIIGKPLDREDAKKILMNLSGKEHKVFTGVAILKLDEKDDSQITFYNVTSVFFKEYTEDELDEYLDTDEPYDKAGAYAIQGYFGRFIDHIEGDYENVMGLPVYRLSEYI